MGKRKKVIIISAIIAGLLIVVLGIAALVKYLGPSSEQAQYEAFTKVEENQVPLLLDYDIADEYAIKVGDEEKIFIPSSLVQSKMDKRVYIEENNQTMYYLVCDGEKEEILTEKAGEDGKSNLVKVKDKYYVSLEFLQKYSPNNIEYIKKGNGENRIIVCADASKEYSFVNIIEDEFIRKGPNKKYPYYTDVKAGTKLILRTEIQEENGYVSVMTMDGIMGYVPKEKISQISKEKIKIEKSQSSIQQKKMDEKVVLGWDQMANETSAKYISSSLEFANSMNVISPTFFQLSDEEGNIISLASNEYVDKAHAKGKKVWGLVSDLEKKVKLSKILSDYQTRNKLINKLVGEAISCNMDGILVDFESVKSSTAAAYLEFLRELTLKAHTNDIVVSTSVYPPAKYNEYYDLSEQGKIVDYVIVMAYNENDGTSKKAGSVSSYDFVKKSVEDTLKKVPKERSVIALAFYTRLWKEKKNGKAQSAGIYGMSGAESLLSSHDKSPKWDKKTQQYFGTYKEKGSTYKIWLEEETSLKKKLEEIMKKEVAGVAFWKLGFERAATWITIGEAVK